MLLNIRVLELNVSLLKYWWLGVLYSLFFFFNLFYVASTFSMLLVDVNLLVFFDFGHQLLEWTSISEFGELVFLYFPHLLILAGLILFVAIVSPVVLTFISFAPSAAALVRFHRTQDIFQQTLRLSIDKNF